MDTNMFDSIKKRELVVEPLTTASTIEFCQQIGLCSTSAFASVHSKMSLNFYVEFILFNKFLLNFSRI